MIDLFVYSWYYTGFTVYGHCLDDAGEYRLLRVTDFMPSCFVEGETVPESTVVPAKAEYKRMLSSRDISCRRPFYRLYFRNGRDMESFSRERSGRCYMADIPQVTAFLSESGADHVGWIRVNQTSRELRVRRSEIIPVPDRIPLSSPRVMAFDIEVRSSDSGMPQPYRIADTVEMISVVVFGDVYKVYIMHTLKDPLGIDGATDLMFDDEVGLVTGFFDLVGKEDPTVLTGFNVYGFDLHYLVSRLRLRLIEIPDVSRGVPGSVDLIKVDWTSGAYGSNSYDRLVVGGRVILDMYLYFRRMKLDRYSLDFVSYKFLGEGKNDMPYARMAAAFESGDIVVLKEVAEYCIQDSVLVMRLFDKVQMWIDACEISKITRCGMEEIYTRGEQMKMISQCVAECAKRDIVLQPQLSSEWNQYEGAFVLDPVKGVYDGCSILDFQSLYPSIIIAYNICPSTYVMPRRTTRCGDDDVHCVDSHRFRKEPVGLLPGMIQRILDERKAVKDLMKTMSDRGSVEYIVLDRRQNALKICANSVYGMMGFKNSRYFGHLGCAESVTTVGRLLLVDIVDRIQNSYPVKVVYGDTDSCMLWHKTTDEDENVKLARSICDDVTASIPSPMALKFEAYCDKVILLTKKRYVLVGRDSDGSPAVSYKGVMNARRDYCKYAKDTYAEAVRMVALGIDRSKIESYIDGRIFTLVSGRADVRDLVVTKSLAKKLSAYKVNQPHVVLARRLVQKTGNDISEGTRLEYVYAVDADTRTKCLVTPEEFAEGGWTADGRFYVDKQIATQLDDVLSAVGMGNYITDTWK
jgi:DNA polymerase delta subunit 1